MIICKYIYQIQHALFPLIKEKSIGFVPTMGALHKGHFSLIEACKKSCDVTVVSIYVNPAQFNDVNDYEKYPKNPEEDLAMLKESEIDYVFIPETKEIYPEDFTSDIKNLDLGSLGSSLEAYHRPGHFDGVVKVVDRLLNIIRPDKLFMGQKDFQQYLIVRKLIEHMNYPVEMQLCPVIREQNGLALSSRNRRLDKNDRTLALGIIRSLEYIKDNLDDICFPELKKYVQKKYFSHPRIQLEYLELVSAEDLSPVNEKAEVKKLLVIAAYIGEIRIIDNILLDQ